MTIVPIARAHRTNRILFPGFIGYDFMIYYVKIIKTFGKMKGNPITWQA